MDDMCAKVQQGETTMPKANDAAVYFLSLSDTQEGELISNLKLQKLLYYAQGVHLALHDTPLFGENIEAWAHGPVVPEVYRKYKTYGDNPIRLQDTDEVVNFSKIEQEVLDEVYQVYGQFSAWKLREMTHDEAPWKNSPQGYVITPKIMKDHFKSLIIDDE